ncbi:MAG: SMP-30/gluconolactonase/LRE family protein [Pseudomonadota bacterium]
MMEVFDNRVCALGEGPLWHPERRQLYWFDILGKRLLTRSGAGEEGAWNFDLCVSAAGWADRDRLLIANEEALVVFDLGTGASTHVCDLERTNPLTRSNDGRADPIGGFWIGTMGKDHEAYAGAIYRWYRGELRQLFDRITVPNSICFSPDGAWAYFTDTWSKRVQRVALDAEGWPARAPEVFVDLRENGLNPDGSVVDAQGRLWNAQWGAHRIACYGPDGRLLETVECPAEQVSCPAFGDGQIFATSAAVGLHGAVEGLTYAAPTAVRGQPEHRVVL